ncbi:acyl-CoA thioester hydrolase, YbgC/YbaW family [delta proteobacterium NaphS2]|nr:acyl-CoA thioester hydrolase, YbgC/YbaW family [delta proteobacterium NaphS2]
MRNETDGRVWHHCTSRVLYADTDRSGLVYHSNYFRFFELGRASLMRDTAYPYREIESDGRIYPIIEVGVTYHSSLRYDDPLRIYTTPGKLERVRLLFDYIITHGETQQIVCKGFTRHCALNEKGTPVAIDEKTRHLWKVFPK